MSDRAVWELIKGAQTGINTCRLKVDGGYIYHMTDIKNATHAIFIPDSHKSHQESDNAPIAHLSARDVIDEANRDNRAYISLCQRISSDIQRDINYEHNDVRNLIAELSLKINKQQSDLREFEKQMAEPLKTRISELEEWTRKDEDKIYERIEKLERLADTINAHQHSAEEFVRAVEKDIKEVLSSQDCRINDLFNRIETHQYLQPNEDVKECYHVWSNSLLLSMPPKRQCVKCNVIQSYIPVVECSSPIETLSVCGHGRPIKYNDCDKCKEQNKC